MANENAAIEDFNDLIDNTPLAAWAVDTEGKVLTIKGGMFTRRQGRDLQKLVGMSVYDPQFAQEDKLIGDYHRRAIQGESFVASTTLAGHVYEVHFSPYRKDGAIVGAVALATDVTVCRMAQEEHEMLASLIKCSEDAIIGMTVTGTIVSWNPAAERTFGYSAEEMIGQPITKIVPPDRMAEFESIAERIKAGESVSSIETVRVRKDGSRVNVSVTASPIRNEKGEVNGASAIDRDISDDWWLKREKDALIFMTKAFESASTLEEAFSHLPTMFAQRFLFPIVTLESIDPATQTATLVGSHGIDVPGMIAAKPIASENSACFDALRTGMPIFESGSQRTLQFLAPGPVRIEANTCVCVPIRSAGVIRAVLTFASGEQMYLDPYLHEVMAVVSGVLGRHIAFWEDEQRLRRSETQFRLISEYSSDVIMELTAAGQVTYVSPACTQMLGWTPEEFIERSAYEFVHQDDIESAQRYHAQIYAVPGAHTGTYRLRHKDGQYVWIEVHASSIRNANGDVVEIIASLRDVTGRMQSNAQTVDANKDEIGMLHSALSLETRERLRLQNELDELRKEFEKKKT